MYHEQPHPLKDHTFLHKSIPKTYSATCTATDFVSKTPSTSTSSFSLMVTLMFALIILYSQELRILLLLLTNFVYTNIPSY